jgi:putative transposase
LPGLRVVRVLDRLAETIGLPDVLVMDNGPEFSGRALDTWAYARGALIEAWRIDYNTLRPHSALRGATPEQCANSFCGR